MKIEQKDNYILISPEENSFDVFFNLFKENHLRLKKDHLIIKLSDNFMIIKEDIFVFLKYAEQHQKNGTSFVVICSDVDADDFPETFNIVPTLVEAEDVLEMENIQRDLGF
ncbi:conserved hypothetical protein [Tenacibaculum maritimum]|uniref:hypothetical protein n=1 Tax=Tenacibaculum maritimum TaxID=107401 RepID=UPI0012E6B278|nr:hypothetical protein [Tenacibaculum maritimum]CAA0183250.1 conserved hypothetical protein [Tenacibaculum maritimum]CAA0194499.1 conserved hypothetical protein [Tenacibaculum maritimum]CAA0257208.1 conserved hypothetical protein [Tenacibaculum maritimum]